MKFKSRVKGHGEADPEQLLANPNNFRLHSRKQQDAMQGALEEIGWIDEIIVNTVTGHVINGHMRVAIAMRNNEPTVPVRYVELSPEEENIALASFDPLGQLATQDRDTLGLLVDNANAENAAMREFLESLVTQQEQDTRSQQDEDDEPSGEDDLGPPKFIILVDCKDEEEQVEWLETLIEAGLNCRALTS